ncbi:MAG TPA: zinc finger domain-containing protein [Candidatus Nanoarchaeia archaeon]|nr:zinc finger domain-containing protein [Candidatus Nanoarchaeia archaeon]
MTRETFCSSCNIKITNLAGSVKFLCPSCGNAEIVRCPHCRKITTSYTCPSCEFTGPN